MVKIIDWFNVQKIKKKTKQSAHIWWKFMNLAKLLLNLPEFQVYLKPKLGESQILLWMFHKVLQIKRDLHNR